MTDKGASENSMQRLAWSTAILLFWPAAIGGTILDLWSKHAVFEWLATVPGQQVVLIEGFLNFILAENKGAAFSIFQGWRGFLVLISAAALVTEIVIFFTGRVRDKLVMFAMGCTAGGIAGNLYDRLFHGGGVRDFIDVYVGPHHWPTFNAADSLLCIGVGLIIISSLTSSTEKK
ncbi:MAG: signal peptidase II [Planctomycetaceae bacterium]|nr:signal peptidase II [Planctomycetaceae bacterium]